MSDPHDYLINRRWLAFTWAMATGSTAEELAAQFRLTEEQSSAALHAWAEITLHRSIAREAEYRHAASVLHATAQMLAVSSAP